MATPATEMEAFFSATKTQPQSEEELHSVLADLPRRALQALSKAYGVKATLKRESLVEMLMRTLKEKLWPATEAEQTNAVEEATVEKAVEEVEKTEDVVEEKEKEKEEEEGGGKAEETTAAAAEEEKVTPEEPATDSMKPATVEKKKSTALASAAVGKKAAVQRKTPKSNESPKGKAKKTATVKVTAKAVSPSVVLEKLHAKEIAKQPTLQQHDQAKKQRAATLLSASTSKFSVVKKTRSKTKELADAATAAAAAADKSITKTLSFGAPTPVKQKPPVSAPAALPSQKETKKGAGYKPYVGKLPAFEGDSLFSPKKSEPRPAPMAVAVMKAARVMTPKKTAPTPTKKAMSTPATKTVQTLTKKPAVPTQAKRKTVAAPIKKTPTVTATKKASVLVKKAPSSSSSDKENSAPPTSSDSSTEKLTNALAMETDKPVAAASGSAPKKPTTAKPRVPVKATSTKLLTQEAKKGERRAKFAQDAKTKSTVARRQARNTPSTASTN